MLKRRVSKKKELKEQISKLNWEMMMIMMIMIIMIMIMMMMKMSQKENQKKVFSCRLILSQ